MPQPPQETAAVRLRRLAKNSGIYALGNIGIKLMTALLAPLYTILLTPEAFGVWGLGSMLMTGLLLAFNPALHGAVTRFYFDHEHDLAAKQRFQSTIAIFLLSWASLLTVVLMLLGPWLFETLFEGGLRFWPYGFLIIATSAISVVGVVPRATWTASEKATRLVSINGLSTTTNLLTALGLVAVARVGVVGLFIARFAAVAVVTWPFVRFLRRHVRWVFEPHLLAQALRFSLPLVPHLLAHWILAMSDRFIIERMLGVGMVGVYASGYVFIEAINTVSTSMNSAWVPQFTRAYADRSEHPFIARTVTYYLLGLISAVLVLATLSPSLIRLVFDPRYHDAAALTPILVLGGLFQGLYYLFVAVLFFHKRNRIVPVLTVTAGVCNVGLTVWWLPILGLAGAAWATGFGYFILVGGMALAASTMGGLPVERRRLMLLFGWALALAGVCFTLGPEGHPLVELGVRVGCLAAGFSMLWWLPVWDATERAWIRRQMSRVLRRKPPEST